MKQKIKKRKDKKSTWFIINISKIYLRKKKIIMIMKMIKVMKMIRNKRKKIKKNMMRKQKKYPNNR